MVALRSVLVQNRAAPKTVYANGPAAAYDSTSNKTFVAFLGLDRDLYVTYWDHATRKMGPAYKADSRTIAVDNNHPAPSICIDSSGYIHIVWSSHNTAGRYVKSNSPRDISAWTAASLTPDMTYPTINVDASGNLYVVYRAGDNTSHASPAPSHAYGAIIISTNGGSTWSSPNYIVDTTGATESATDFYPIFSNGVAFDDDGNLRIIWSVARGTVHDDSRENIYAAKYDPSDGTLYALDDTNLGSSIDWTDHTSCLVVTRSDIAEGSVAARTNSDITITYAAPQSGDRQHYAVRWNGSSWSEINPTIDSPDLAGLSTPFYDGTDLYALFTTEAGPDLELWQYSSGWSKVETLLTDPGGQGFDRVNPVRNGIALAIPTMVTGDTSATVSDLLGMYLIDREARLPVVAPDFVTKAWE